MSAREVGPVRVSASSLPCPAPDPAVQAESTGGLSAAERAAIVDAMVGADNVQGFSETLLMDPEDTANALLDTALDGEATVEQVAERILADRLAAQAAVQAREVAEARADERERIARAIEAEAPSPGSDIFAAERVAYLDCAALARSRDRGKQ